MSWLPLYLLVYAAVALYWARLAAIGNQNFETYFSAGHGLPPWISALVLAGASVSGWVVLTASASIAADGFGVPALLQAGIALALPGVLFHKRTWIIGQHLRLSSQGELFRSYYGSEFLVVVSAVVGVVFAVGFAGLQLRALGALASQMTDGAATPELATSILALVLGAYVVIGGLRAVAWLGVIQSVLLVASLVVLGGFALGASGGFTGLTALLRAHAEGPAGAGAFSISGIIQFTLGVGREAAVGHEGTAVASLSLALALMGFQASPLATKLVLSTASARGIAAGQTWVLAGVFGALIAFVIALLGAAGLVRPDLSPLSLVATLPPWFAAWIFVGILCGVQLIAGLALIAAGEALVRQIYKPWFHGALSRKDTVSLARVVIAVLLTISVGMQALAPVALSMLGALALPLALQLWTPMLGLTWLRWFTAPAVITGVGFGVAGVLLTEPMGHALLGFVGLDLPWGRWPWTIHSAAWGMAANLAATILVSAVTQRRARTEAADEVLRVIASLLPPRPAARALRATAWSVVLAWLFLAVGPGLVFGQGAFTLADGEWVVGMPSLWAWSLLFWALGVGVIWFLAYKMEMASPLAVDVPVFAPRPRLRADSRAAERERLRMLVIVVVSAFTVTVLLAFAFGRLGGS